MDNHSIRREAQKLIEELHSVESSKTVLSARVGGESLEAIGKRLNVTRERVRQIEAKYTRKFAVWYNRTQIIDKIIADSNTALSTDLLKKYFENYYPEMIYLLRLYKESCYYSGELPDVLKLCET